MFISFRTADIVVVVDSISLNQEGKLFGNLKPQPDHKISRISIAFSASLYSEKHGKQRNSVNLSAFEVKKQF